MVKINSGSFGGREIAQPPENITRPVTQKVRAAIFSTLGDVEGLTVLDLYAGSGALGLEALSLGAQSAVFVDNSAKATDVIRKNISALDVKNRTNLKQQSAKRYLQDSSDTFDLIFFDPPYAVFDTDVLPKVTKLLTPNGVAIISCSSKTKLPTKLDSAAQIKAKIYGDTQIAYYKLKN